MQQHPHGSAPRSSPTQSRAQVRRPATRTTDAPDAVHDTRTAALDAAHTRAPVLIREPTLFESLSRNLRTFLPASISPPAPRRRPLSSGSPPPVRAPTPEGEHILWAGWDELERTRVLLLAYPTGLQVWDTTDLSAVRELLNLRADALCSAGPVLAAAVVPGAIPATLAVLTPAHLTVYALTTHTVVNQVPFSSPCALAARPSFIIVATLNPSTLHILSSSTLVPLHTVPLTAPPIFAASHRLLAYATPTPATTPSSPAPTFLAASTSPVRALWTAVEDRAWGAAAAGVRFSRSAPAASGNWPANPTQTPPPDPAPWIAVLDLAHVTETTPPPQIAHFAPFSPDNGDIAHLAFASAKGAGPPILYAAPRGGQGVAVFELRGAAMPWHRYALRRGVTSAKVEGIVCAEGGRWVGVVTARRTVHIFATNREGGAPDVRAHLEGRSVNNLTPRPLSTELAPLVRLRLSVDAPPDTPPGAPVSSSASIDPFPSTSPVPLALAFLSPATSRTLPPTLRSASPAQDLLLFDPASGVLALRRLVLDPAEGELSARESVIATWGLQRERGWPDVWGGISDTNLPAPGGGQKRKTNFLAHAELSTHTPMAPRSLYLSHQFSFHALGEDYAALLARDAFAALPRVPVTVRRAVEVRDGATGSPAEGDGEEEFLQAQPKARRTSFDEPLASAIGAPLDFSPSRSPPVLPMLPNGNRPSSVLGALPIRTKHVAAGVNEGLGRIRKEIGDRVRSPTLRARRVPLAFDFDEVDEALFLDADGSAEGDRERESVEGEGEVQTPEDEEEAWDDGAGKAVAEVEMFDEISAAGFMDEEQHAAGRGEGRGVGVDVGVEVGPVMAAMQGKGGGGGRGRGKRRR